MAFRPIPVWLFLLLVSVGSKAESSVQFNILESDTLQLDPGGLLEHPAEDFNQWKGRFLDDILVNRQRERSPGRAVLLSAILPGAGQVYNGDYLKLTVFYGATGGLLYALDFNRTQYNRFQTAYEQRLEGVEDEFVGLIPSARGIRNFRDRYRKDMELTYIGFGLAYLFNVIDAFISAHLATFDIDDDLSFQLRPSLTPGMFGPAPGIGMVVRF